MSFFLFLFFSHRSSCCSVLRCTFIFNPFQCTNRHFIFFVIRSFDLLPTQTINGIPYWKLGVGGFLFSFSFYSLFLELFYYIYVKLITYFFQKMCPTAECQQCFTDGKFRAAFAQRRSTSLQRI